MPNNTQDRCERTKALSRNCSADIDNIIMEKFDIHILGCGSALPTTRHLPGAQILNIRDKLFMIDCGEGTQLQMRRSHLKFNRLNHIFISHLHGDHCFGLIGLISTFGLLERTADLHIHSHPYLEELLKPWLAYFCNGLPYKVIFHAIDPKTKTIVYEDKSVTVESIPLQHRIPTCGFLFREKATPRHIIREMIDFYRIPVYMIPRIKNGEDFVTEDGQIIPNERLTKPSAAPRSYAYCSDTMYLPELSDQLKGVDLLYHEATFAETESARARQTMHSTAAQAGKIASLSGVGQLLIGHFSARYEDENVLLQEAKAHFPNVLLAYENMKIEL